MLIYSNFFYTEWVLNERETRGTNNSLSALTHPSERTPSSHLKGREYFI